MFSVLVTPNGGLTKPYPQTIRLVGTQQRELPLAGIRPYVEWSCEGRNGPVYTIL